VRRRIDQPPAAVLIAGDCLYEADDDLTDHIAEVVGLLRPLAAAPIPTFAGLGNHDYSMDERRRYAERRHGRAPSWRAASPSAMSPSASTVSLS